MSSASYECHPQLYRSKGSNAAQQATPRTSTPGPIIKIKRSQDTGKTQPYPIAGEKGSNAMWYRLHKKNLMHPRKSSGGKSPIMESYYQDGKLHVKLKGTVSPSLSRRTMDMRPKTPKRKDGGSPTSSGSKLQPYSISWSASYPPTSQQPDYDVIENRALGPVFNTLVIPKAPQKIPFGRSPIPLGYVKKRITRKHPHEEVFCKWAY